MRFVSKLSHETGQASTSASEDVVLASNRFQARHHVSDRSTAELQMTFHPIAGTPTVHVDVHVTNVTVFAEVVGPFNPFADLVNPEWNSK